MAMMSGEYDVTLNGRTVRIYCDIQVDGHNWQVYFTLNNRRLGSGQYKQLQRLLKQWMLLRNAFDSNIKNRGIEFETYL